MSARCGAGQSQAPALRLSQPSLGGNSSESRKWGWKVSPAIKSSRVPEGKPDHPVHPVFALIPGFGDFWGVLCLPGMEGASPSPCLVLWHCKWNLGSFPLGSFGLETHPLLVFDPQGFILCPGLVLGCLGLVLGSQCGRWSLKGGLQQWEKRKWNNFNHD